MTPEETEALTKLIGKETINKIYSDGASEATKELGKALTDVAKTLRLILAPIQLTAALQDRLSIFIDKVRNNVPEENQIPAPAYISGPILEKLKYLDESNHLKELYINLLARAIDKERVNEAHPAFITIIEQLSPDEALLIKIVAEENIKCEVKTNTIVEVGTIPKEILVEHNFPIEKIAFEQNFEMYLKHLNYLNLIDMPQYNMGQPDETINERPIRIHRFIILSEFGKKFYNACVK